MGRHIFAKVSSGWARAWDGSDRSLGHWQCPLSLPDRRGVPRSSSAGRNWNKCSGSASLKASGAAPAPLPEPDGTDWKPQHLHKPDVPGGMGAPPGPRGSPGLPEPSTAGSPLPPSPCSASLCFASRLSPRSPRGFPAPLPLPKILREPGSAARAQGKELPAPARAQQAPPCPSLTKVRHSKCQLPPAPDVLHYFCEQVLYIKKIPRKKKGSVLYSGFVFD